MMRLQRMQKTSTGKRSVSMSHVRLIRRRGGLLLVVNDCHKVSLQRRWSPRIRFSQSQSHQQRHCSLRIANSLTSNTGKNDATRKEIIGQQIQQLKCQMQQNKMGALLLGIAAMVVALLKQATPKEMQVASSSPVGGAMKTFRMAAMVAPFASMGIGGTGFLVTKAVGSFLQTYLLLLFLRVLLSWFPAFNWERQPWLTLRQMTDPYLQLFRGLIPPLLGMIDFTPLLGFFILQWASGKLASATMEDSVEAFW